jgi:general stress protein YciG
MKTQQAKAGRLGGQATAKKRSRKVSQAIGRKGGLATAKNRTKAERSASARKAARARWSRRK